MADCNKKTMTVFYLLLGLTVFSLKCEGKIPDFIKQFIAFFTSKPASPPTDAKVDSLVNQNIMYRFFDEAFTPGGFQYAYPEKSKVTIAEGIARNGNASLQFDLASDDYSGGSVCLYNNEYDLRPLLKKAALQFWIKGAVGNELTTVALIDEEKTDQRKTVVRVPVHWFGPITTEWTLISIPLESFIRLNERGFYWDDNRKEEVPADFDWKRVAEFRIEVKKDENKSFRVWIDDIFIVKTAR
ncbi:MAG: hypothetical protein JW913_14275 [Chitinispirillaceae bacterium]|nr:hypothetical protein [Chitinispirillaceae bacterium]